MLQVDKGQLAHRCRLNWLRTGCTAVGGKRPFVRPSGCQPVTGRSSKWQTAHGALQGQSCHCQAVPRRRGANRHSARQRGANRRTLRTYSSPQTF